MICLLISAIQSVNVVAVTTPGLRPGLPDTRPRCPLVIRETSRSLPASEAQPGRVGGLDCSGLPLSSCSLQFPAQENSNHYVTVSVSHLRLQI